MLSNSFKRKKFGFAVHYLDICTSIIITMETKLTLRLNEGVIEKAKIYANSHKISLSKMIENYLDSLTTKNDKEILITPFVESISGVIDLPSDYDYKKEYGSFLSEKYK